MAQVAECRLEHVGLLPGAPPFLCEARPCYNLAASELRPYKYPSVCFMVETSEEWQCLYLRIALYRLIILGTTRTATTTIINKEKMVPNAAKRYVFVDVPFPGRGVVLFGVVVVVVVGKEHVHTGHNSSNPSEV